MKNTFRRQYAIALPDGELLKRPREATAFYVSLFRDSGFHQDEPEETPMVWDSREAAERRLQSLRADAKTMGMELHACIVQRLCSPFTVADPAEHFITELENWMNEGER